MVTRTSKAKATITDVPFVETTKVEAPAVEEFTYSQRLHKMLDDALEGAGAGASWKRMAIAAVAGILVSGAVGYGAGYLLAYLIVGAALLTGSAFLCSVLYVLGIIMAMYLGYRASGYVYLKIIDESVDRAASSAWNKVTGLFSTAPRGVPA